MSEKFFTIDTNVIVSAFLFANSKPRQALEKAQDLGLVLLSDSVFIEILEVIGTSYFSTLVVNDLPLKMMNGKQTAIAKIS